MPKIQLTKAAVTIVDGADYHWISQGLWQLHSSGYAAGFLFGQKVLLHRLILLAPETATVDHVNRDKLDNRRQNLRLATQTEQNQNRQSRGKSPYLGVWRNGGPKGCSWTAMIKKRDRRFYLGSYSTDDMAAFAYDAAARILYGPNAKLNFPDRAAPIDDLLEKAVRSASGFRTILEDRGVHFCAESWTKPGDN